jgi:MscS family membrane protein
MHSPESNTTQSLDVLDNLSMNLPHKVQELLHSLYVSKYGDFFSILIFSVPLAQWLGATIIFLILLVFRHLFTSIIMGTLQNLAKYTENYYDDRIVSALKAPIRFAFIIVGLHIFFLITLQETETIKNILNTLILYDIFWGILAISEAIRELFHIFASRFSEDLYKEVGNFILTIVKILISGIGLGMILQVWGINVTALVASLGLGGLAFALAARDAASNLFGSFSLLADKSIRIGEWIKVDGVEGIVEDIGMRTTKIRSFGKSLITMPNQILANNPIENFSRRGVRRIKINLGLTYNTSSTQIILITKEIKYMLYNHPNISQKETLLVNFNRLGDSALNIFIYTFTSTSNWEKYLNIRQDIHLKVMKIVEENNCSFAFPSQSIYIEENQKSLKEET